MQCFAIGDEFTLLGLRLIGIPGAVTTTPEEASAVLQEAASRQDIGLILITERVADTIKETIEEIRLRRKLPLVLEIPDRKGPIPGRETVVDLVRRALGIRL